MDNRLMLFALHQMEGIGWKTVSRLVRQFPVLSDILTLNYAEWLELGLTPLRAEQVTMGLQQLQSGRPDKQLKLYEERQIGWISVWDEDYPELLKETAEPPWILYFHGRLEFIHKPCIAMVGTRKPTAYGKVTAERLSESLSSAGICVVSGLARGIDSAAHEGALREAGGTIGVLGCSLDEVYPPENKLLYRRTSESGLLLSEYPLGTKPRPGLFPQRNRIIAGLSLGVVVVEAALKSGSLITADLALEASRDVFAIPGPISSPKSEGTLHWLKLGAKLVTGPGDILEEYAARISLKQKTNMNPKAVSKATLSADEQQIYDLLTSKPMNIEELLSQSQYKFGHLHSVLINLLMMQRIVELPGSVYTVP
ncbi:MULTISPECIES: DNA-processing protein DprA [unclassified Paenibacillus]|uniref:DNA-processing protein DprA n=1 Tax=unclassified Paenibacillus TaxID=185978 RepID=UPI001AEB7D89|nr:MULTISPECIES: DNA-processing protein DprA [unclassified Paenibacillus]MBP1156020.1 DNA processing protein [Paenibacillus sp. PvP091]MBP1168594.1 DNA processing protein [Paenibacillus sp. PvR098]MBP2439622.1 DNA processing protein [Paenibacillus sp. PvP052]